MGDYYGPADHQRKLVARIQELTEACEAVVRWFDAEDQNLGSFHDKMDLCKYAEWSARKALGQDVGEFKGVPRLTLTPAELADNSIEIAKEE